MPQCKSIGCNNITGEGLDFCPACFQADPSVRPPDEKEEMDVYSVHHFFDIMDPSGCIQAASTNLLLSYQDGGKHLTHRVKEARKILTRWLEINGLE